MILSTIYDDLMVVFRQGERNGLLAAAELDGILNASLSMHKTVVVVKFWPTTNLGDSNEKTIDRGLKEAKEILKKYNIPYKIKRFTF